MRPESKPSRRAWPPTARHGPGGPGLLRAASSPGAVAGLLQALRDADVRPLLSKSRPRRCSCTAPGDRDVRVEGGRYLAARIAGARFVEVEGEDHWFWVGEQSALLEGDRAGVRADKAT